MGKKKKYTTSIINNIRVTSVTKREFYENKEFYKSQNIKSAQRLQEVRNIRSKILKGKREKENIAIKEAYYKQMEKFEELGYPLQLFLDLNKKIQKRAEELRIAEEKGQILTVGKPAFPISDGRINLKRLKQTLRAMSRSVSSIRKSQREMILNNIEEVFNGYADSYRQFKKMYPKMKDKDKFIKIIDTTIGELFWRYDIRDFTEDARERIWYSNRGDIHKFDNMVVSMADELKDWEVLKWFGI